MATLALGIAGAVVGGMIGGPFGAQLGFMAGATLGGALFPQKSPAPTVQDLKFSGATYGTPIEQAYGTMRVPGTYIWAPDLVPHQTTTGKGGPSVTTTSYSASFAVGICEGPVSGILRIWFDTTLVYDATSADQPVADTSLLEALAIYLGTETQDPDPTIQGTEGAAFTPAYRGLCYLVLNNLDLTNYGNRRPNVSAEVSPSLPAFPVQVVDERGPPLDGLYVNPAMPFAYSAGGTHLRVYSRVDGLVVDGSGTEDWQQYVDWTNIVSMANKTCLDAALPPPPRGLCTNIGAGHPTGNSLRERLAFGRKQDSGNVYAAINSYVYDQAYGLYFDARGILQAAMYQEGNSGGPVCFVGNSSWRTGNFITDSNTNDVGAGWGPGFRTVAFDNTSIDSCNRLSVGLPATGSAPAGSNATGYSGCTYPGGPHPPFEINNDGGERSFIWSETLGRQYQIGGAPAYGSGDNIFEAANDGSLIYYDLLASDNVTIIHAPSMVLPGCTRSSYNLSNHQSQAITGDRFWTSLAIWIDLDALRPRLDANDNVVYGNPIIEDHSDDPWAANGFGGGFRAMAYDSMGDCFWATDSGGDKVYRLFLHRRMAGTAFLTLGELVTIISKRVSLTDSDLDVTQLTETVDGFRITGPTTGRAALEQLMIAYAFDMVESGGKIKAVKRGGAAVATIPQNDLAAHISGAQMPVPLELSRALEQQLPKEIDVLYYNLASQYQQGQQRSRRVTTKSVNIVTTNLGCAFTDDHAKQIAERVMWTDWLGRTTFQTDLPRKYAYLEPTDVIVVGDAGFNVRLTKTLFDHAVVKCDMQLEDASLYISAATGGNAPQPPDGPHITVPTMLKILDMPAVREIDMSPGLYFAACGYLPGWTGCFVFKDNVMIRTMLSESIIGNSVSVLGTWQPFEFDEANSVDISLVHSGMELFNATETAVLQGANLAWLGGEIIGFKNVAVVSPNVVRLTGLLRAQQGTEFMLDQHRIGELFVLLDPNSLRWVDGALADVGITHQYRATTIGSISGISQSFTGFAEPIRPYSVAEPAAIKVPSGDFNIGWIGRSIHNHEWMNYIDAPIDPAFVDYKVEILLADASAIVRSMEVQQPSVVYTSAQQVTDFGSAQASILLRIGQRNSNYGVGEMVQLDSSTGNYTYTPPEPLPVNPPGPPTPPPPPGHVDYEFTWPADSLQTQAPVVGQNFVIGFTTGASAITTGHLAVSEFFAQPPTQRRCWIALDSGGTQPVGPVSTGSTCTVFFGSGVNQAPLQPNTRYYFIHQIIDDLPAGTHVGSIFNLA